MNQTRQGIGMKMENMGGNPGMRPSMQPGMGGQVADKNPADASEILIWSSELSFFFHTRPHTLFVVYLPSGHLSF